MRGKNRLLKSNFKKYILSAIDLPIFAMLVMRCHSIHRYTGMIVSQEVPTEANGYQLA